MTIGSESYEEFRERLNFHHDMKIDPDALDVEWCRQAELIFAYTEELALAREDMDRASDAVEIIYAELDGKIRDDPKGMGVPVSGRTDAPTEKAVASAIWTCVSYQKARDAYHDARLRYGLLQAAQTSLTQKKDALENLVRLANSNYYAAPESDKSLGERMKQRNRQDAKVTNRIDVENVKEEEEPAEKTTRRRR